MAALTHIYLVVDHRIGSDGDENIRYYAHQTRKGVTNRVLELIDELLDGLDKYYSEEDSYRGDEAHLLELKKQTPKLISRMERELEIDATVAGYEECFFTVETLKLNI